MEAPPATQTKRGRRYVVQARYSDPTLRADWHAIGRFDRVSEAVHGCSQAVDLVKEALGLSILDDLPNGFLFLRVWDRTEERLAFWEEESGCVEMRPEVATILDAEIAENLAEQQNPSIGVNFCDKKYPVTEWILDGVKTVEARDTNSLGPYVGRRVGIVRTGRGVATLVGYVTIGRPRLYTCEDEFAQDYRSHRVSIEEPHFAFEEVKYGFPLVEPSRTEPRQLTTRGGIARRLR